MAMERWQVIELVALAAELELERTEASDVRINFDARLPERSTGDRRQVDIAVRGRLGGREFLRIIQVRGRRRPQGRQWIDELAGQIAALGAHRGTLVSLSGFGKKAMKRVASVDERIDLVSLRQPIDDDWAFNWPNPTLTVTGPDGKTQDHSLEALTYADAISGDGLVLLVFTSLGPFESGGPSILWAAAIPARFAANERVPITPYILSPRGSPVPAATGSFSTTRADGVKEVLEWGDPEAIPNLRWGWDDER